MDTCTTACAQMANIPDRLAELKKVVARDGIHFADGGRKNLALRTISCLKTVLSVQKKPPKKTTFFWEAFAVRRAPCFQECSLALQAASMGPPLMGSCAAAEEAVPTWADHVHFTHTEGGNQCLSSLVSFLTIIFCSIICLLNISLYGEIVPYIYDFRLCAHKSRKLYSELMSSYLLF